MRVSPEPMNYAVVALQAESNNESDCGTHRD